jgi:1,4-dihydroxy-2-naphthoate octaprenyltransferase
VTIYAAYLLLLITWVRGPLSPLVMLPWLTLPVAAEIVRVVRNRTEGPSLNRALAQTGLLQLASCMLLSVGVLFS